MTQAFKSFKNKGKLTEADVKAGMREVKLALLEADVNFKVVKDFVAKVSERAVGSEVLESLLPAQQIVKIVNEELVALMGGTNQKLNFAPKPPTIVLMCGLQGAGKTTHCAKLAGMYKKQGKNPLLVACDIYRPAAIKQLQIVGEQVGVPVFEHGTNDPVDTAKDAVRHAIKYGHDLVIIDTAGRLHNKKYLMDELGKITRIIDRELPDADKEFLIVLDATTGQNALSQLKEFSEVTNITGIILTKMDGTAKGGIAVAIQAEMGIPVKYIGVGEQVEDLQKFDSDVFVNALFDVKENNDEQ